MSEVTGILGRYTHVFICDFPHPGETENFLKMTRYTQRVKEVQYLLTYSS